MSFILTQQEADNLLGIEKHYFGNDLFTFPSFGGALRILLHSRDSREEFIFDITRSCIVLTKNTFQTRAKKTIVFARIDIGGAPHRNPDGKEILCPHLHVYREGYGDKWAIPVPGNFSKSMTVWQIINEFMDYCKVITKPIIHEELFT